MTYVPWCVDTDGADAVRLPSLNGQGIIDLNLKDFTKWLEIFSCNDLIGI